MIDKNSLLNFIDEIESFDKMKHGDKIQYYGYYLQKYAGYEEFKPSDLKKCYKESDEIYPNISVYLSKLCKI